MKKKIEHCLPEMPTLGFYVSRVLCSLIKELNKELRTHDLKFQHSGYALLRILNEADGFTQSELAKITGKEKSGIGRIISGLEKEGYVYRTAMNGCTNKVFISEKGKSIMPELNVIVEKINERAFKGFTQKKKHEMMKNLTSVYNNIS